MELPPSEHHPSKLDYALAMIFVAGVIFGTWFVAWGCLRLLWAAIS